jgi:hypothetical protein
MRLVHSKLLKKANVIIVLMIFSLLVVACSNNNIKDNKEINNQQVENKNSENKDVDTENNHENNKSNSIDNNNDKIEDKNSDNNDISDNNDTSKSDVKQEDATAEKTPIEIDYQKVKPNELGHIMVIMYHGISNNPPYHITEEQFLEDLEYMYNNGYRPISMRDYIDNNIKVEAGFTPIVLTYDDGLSSTFSLEKIDGEFVAKKGTAIEILERFAKTHPGFDNKAALYINGDGIFEGEGTVEERINWLVDHGYDVGNHTSSHAKEHMLSKLTSREIMSHIGIVDQLIKNAVPNYTVDSLAYTFGVRPKKPLLNLVSEGEYKGITYNYKVGFREGPTGPYYPPLDNRFTPLKAPRARGSKGDPADMWGFFEYYKKNPHKKYISDGNPDRVSILEIDEKYVNKEKLGDKELYLYKLEKVQ